MKDQVNGSLEARAAWPMVPISEIANHCLGKMLDKHKNKGTPRPYLRNLNVRWFEFDTSDVLDMRFEDHEAERYQARNGDLIVCEGGYPGRAAIWEDDEPIYLQKALHRVRFHEPARAKWVLYWLHLKDLNGSLSEAFSGTGIQHFTKAALSRFEVPLPALEEQKRIVAVLDQAFAALDRARAHAEANLADGGAIFDSWLTTAFKFGADHWPKKALPEISENLDRLRVPITKKDREPGDVPYYGASGVVDHVAEHIFDEPLLLVSEDGANLLARTYPIAFSISGKSWVNNHAHVLRFTDIDSQEFVRLYLNSISIEPWVSGMAQPKLNQKALGSILLPYPDEEDRARIVAEASEVWRASEAVKTNYQAQIDDIADLRQSLLQKAFSGQLTA